ncbi:hypothetical protein V3N99_22205 (plasmid) [Dermatophilaceae bacterium Soc4.6]
MLALAGEALRVERSTAAPVGAADGPARAAVAQVAAVVVSFARFTTVYAEQAREPGTWAPVGSQRWRSLVEQLDALLESTDRTTRGTDLTTRPVPASAEESLAGALDRWRNAVDQVGVHRGEVGGVADRDVRLTARGLMFVHAAAAVDAGAAGHLDLNRVHMSAAQRWDAAATGWVSSVRVPGRPSPTLAGATSDLTRALNDFCGEVRAGRARPQDTAALAHFVRTQVPRIAGEHVTTVAALIDQDAAIVPARRMVDAALAAAARLTPASVTAGVTAGVTTKTSAATAPVTSSGTSSVTRDRSRVSVSLAEAARRGRWVPLPASSPLAADLTGNAETARRFSRAAATAEAAVPRSPAPLGEAFDRAKGLLGGGAGRDSEASEARLVSAAAFSRSTRQNLTPTDHAPAERVTPWPGPGRAVTSDDPHRTR